MNIPCSKLKNQICQSTRHLVACCVKSSLGLSSCRQMKLVKTIKTRKAPRVGANSSSAFAFDKHYK